MMLTRALIPRKDAAPAGVRQSAAIAGVSTPPVPTQVVSGIRDLMISFASQAQNDPDMRRLLEIYVKATSHVHEVVATEAVQSLLFDNPRNPYRPSPQDIYERCSKVNGKWARAAREYFLSSLRSFPSEWGTEPLTEGCRVPSELIKQYLARHLQQDRYVDEELGRLPRDQLAKIPDDCFADGQKTRALADIEKREKETALEEHLDSLDPELRQQCVWVISANGGNRNCRLSGAEIIELARKTLAEEEARTQQLIAKIAALKASDPDLYSRAEQASRRGHALYRWLDMSEAKRAEAIDLALHQIELRREIEAMQVEERQKHEAQKAQ